jgi:molybdate transport system substrate-binding protein
MRLASALAALAGAFLCSMPQAAEIAVACANALRPIAEDLGPAFERATGHKVAFRYATAGEWKGRLEQGEAFDVAVLPVGILDDLAKQEKIVAASRVAIARSPIGVAIRKGAARPDLSSAEAFKRSMKAARSITYGELGATSGNLRKIFDGMGIGDEMKAKTHLVRMDPSEAVAKGDAELAITQMSEILATPGVELAGPLPPEIQVYTVFGAALSPAARDPKAGQVFIRFLASPHAAAVYKAKGIEGAPK